MSQPWFEVEVPFAWAGYQGPIESWLPKQVEVTEWGQLDIEKAERSHEKRLPKKFSPPPPDVGWLF